MKHAHRGSLLLAGLVATLACHTRDAREEPAALRPAPGAVPALTPPSDSAFVPLTCGTNLAWDTVGDSSAGDGDRDIVGDSAFPAMLRAEDDTFTYLRIRVDGNPVQNSGNLDSFGWGVLFDADGALDSYEFIRLLNGVGQDAVEWRSNVQGTLDDPGDPSETLVQSLAPAADYWAANVADSFFGANSDYFLTFAAPKAVLTTSGVGFSCMTTFWGGTSNNGAALDEDLACHDGLGPAPKTLTGGAAGADPDPLGLQDIDGDGTITNLEWDDGTDPCDPDSDDDGVPDGADGRSDTDGDGMIDALDGDSDGDGILDGTEAGVNTPLAGTDTSSANWRPDGDPTTTTDPHDPDSDDDGLLDGEEDTNGNGVDEFDESDPLDPDTDDGGVLDGVEADRGTSTLDAGDDFHAAGSGGCSVNLFEEAAASRAWIGLLAAWCVTMLVLNRPRRRVRVERSRNRPRRLRGIAWVIAAVAASGRAEAQVAVDRSFELQQFRPSPGEHDILAVQSPRVPPDRYFTLRFFANHAARPLRIIDPSNGSTETDLVDSQTQTDIGGSLGLFDRFEIGAMVPVTVSRESQTDEAVPPALQRRVAGTGLADVRVIPKIQIFTRDPWALGITAPVMLPTAPSSDFLGHASVTASPKLLFEGEAGRVRLLANAGLTFREERHFLDVDVGNAFTFGLGSELPFAAAGQQFLLGATITGETGLAERGEEESPVEAMAAVSWALRNGVTLTLAGGRGLTNGYGSPDWRAVFGITFNNAHRDIRQMPPPPIQDISGITLSGNKIELRERVYFETDSATILPRSWQMLDQLAAFLRQNERIALLRIEGHTDSSGSSDHNLILSERRAESVREYLIQKGVGFDRLEAEGFGDAKPIATNDTNSGRATNRRVEFVIVTMQ